MNKFSGSWLFSTSEAPHNTRITLSQEGILRKSTHSPGTQDISHLFHSPHLCYPPGRTPTLLAPHDVGGRAVPPAAAPVPAGPSSPGLRWLRLPHGTARSQDGGRACFSQPLMAAWERSHRSRFTQGFTLRALRLRESRVEVCWEPQRARGAGRSAGEAPHPSRSRSAA